MAPLLIGREASDGPNRRRSHERPSPIRAQAAGRARIWGRRAAKPRGRGHLNYDTNKLNQLMSERDHGRTTFAGQVDEPATVKVNGQAAKVTSTDGGAPFKFERVVNLDAGANTVVVEAKDGQNNVATKTYSVTTTGTSKTYEYDGNGNLRYEKQPNGTVIREYRWDQQNRLVRELHGTHQSVYEYDGESHRTRIKELESSVQTKNETFIWCGSRICQKRSGSTVLRSYFKEGFEENATTDKFYTRDHLGSVREVVASNGTTIGSRLSYDPWGNATESGSGALTDFGFTGHYLDRPTGLSLTLYRAYSPVLGRWLSKDPIGLAGGENLYGYTSNDPGNLVDPLGLSSCAPSCFERLAPIFGSLVARVLCGGVEPKHCDPCPAPPPPESRRDSVPPSAKHYPCPGDHTHHYEYVYDQDPKSCQCYLRKKETVECH